VIFGRSISADVISFQYNLDIYIIIV